MSLLRQQYVKLQAKLSKTEEKYNALLAIHGGDDKSGQNFQLELIKQVGDLYNAEEYRLVKFFYVHNNATHTTLFKRER